MISSIHVDIKKKDILILGKGPTQVLDDTTLTAEKKYAINFTVVRKKFCLILHFNGTNSCLFVNGTEIQKSRAKDSKTVATPLCLGNVSKHVSAENMIKTALNGYINDFSVDYDAIAVDDILDIHKYLIKKNGMI